jgi:5-bromo-4-chloroindolyl phosphate hydrolysis protein
MLKLVPHTFQCFKEKIMSLYRILNTYFFIHVCMITNVRKSYRQLEKQSQKLHDESNEK